jgi:translation initiation factor eIF-2B subunit epsilon
MLDVRAQSIGAIDADEERRQRWEVLDEEEEEEEGICIDEDGGKRGPESGLTDFSSALARGLAGVDTERGTAGAVYGVGLGGFTGEAAANATSDDDFAEVVRDMIISGFASRHAISNLLLEIKSFKFAQNRSYAAVMRAVVPALLDLALDPDAVCRHAEKDSSLSRPTLKVGEQIYARGRVSGVDTDPSGVRDSKPVAAQPRLSEQAAISNIATQLQHWKPLLVALNQEEEVEEALLEATEAYALESKGMGDQAGASRLLYDIFGLGLLTYVNEGLLSPAIAVAWADAYNDDDSSDERSKLFREARTQKFVKWVREYEADDSTSSDGGTSDSE